jgi:hypothetical protein
MATSHNGAGIDCQPFPLCFIRYEKWFSQGCLKSGKIKQRNPAMNNILELVIIAVIALIAVPLLYWVGFRFAPPPVAPELEPTDPLKQQPLDESVPAPIKRFLQMVYGEKAAIPVTVTAWGNGRIIVRDMGRLGSLWAPFRWSLYLIPGKEFVMRTTITWFTRRMLQGGDELRNGHGRFVMSKDQLENANIDNSEWVMLWVYTLITAPAVLIKDPKITLEEVEENSIKVGVPYKGGDFWYFTLNFDTDTGELRTIHTYRPASRDGRKIPYQLSLDEYHPVGIGTLAGSIGAAWDGEYFQYNEMAGVRYNVDVSEVMLEGASEKNPSPPYEPEEEQQETAMLEDQAEEQAKEQKEES